MEELDLKELFEIFWNKKVQIILITLIFMVIGFVYSTVFVVPEYQSSTTLVLAQAEKNATDSSTSTEAITSADLTINSKLVSTYSELVKSKNVLRAVISNLNIKIDEEDLRNNISVTSVKNTELIEITVMNINPIHAEMIANEIAKVFTQKVAEIYNINNVHIVDEAEIANEPYNIDHTKDIVIFACIGLVVAVGYALLANMFDTTIKTQEDIEKQFKIPVLACIPVYECEDVKGGKKK